MPVKHAFVSAKSDAADTTLVRPSNWNDDHDVSEGVEIQPASAATVPLTVRGAASQSANLVEILGSDGTIVARFKAPAVEDGLLHVQHTFPNAPTGLFSGVRAQLVAKGTATVSQRTIGMRSEVTDHGDVVDKAITGAADNGSGLIRITAIGHTFATGDKIAVAAVGGTTEANGAWTITVIDANTFDLQGSTFTNTYTSGGTATNRPMMTGVSSVVAPSLDRGGLTGTAQAGDDVNGFTASNAGAGKATEAFYAGGEGDWFALFSADAPADFAFHAGSQAFAIAGIDLRLATFGAGGAIRLPNNVPVTALQTGGTTTQLFKFGTGNRLNILTTLELAGGVVLPTSGGTQLGTATNQLLGFWNATPVVQQVLATGAGATVDDVISLLQTLGLCRQTA
jgi:hypothetical protein